MGSGPEGSFQKLLPAPLSFPQSHPIMPLSYRPDALWASISSAKNTQILRLDALDQLPENLFFVPILPMASLNHIILVDAGSHGLRVWIGVGKIRSAWGGETC